MGVSATALAAEPAQPETALQEQEAPTFTRDVLPILQRSCQRCHRPGTGAPILTDVTNYEQTSQRSPHFGI